jgi:hypothetical protein
MTSTLCGGRALRRGQCPTWARSTSSARVAPGEGVCTGIVHGLAPTPNVVNDRGLGAHPPLLPFDVVMVDSYLIGVTAIRNATRSASWRGVAIVGMPRCLINLSPESASPSIHPHQRDGAEDLQCRGPHR